MTERKCSTCKHFEAAPMWKKGWCRNPLLFSPQQSHLVGEDDLDCNRGMGSYWEPLDSDSTDDELYGRFVPPPPRTIAPASTAPYPTQPAPAQSGRRTAPQAVTQPVTTPVGARAGRAPTPVARPRPRTRQGALEPVAHSSPTGYAPPEDRYSWGDYLRRSYPVIGVILLLGAFWVLASRQLAARDQTPETIVPTVPQGLGQPPTAAVITPTVAGAPAPAGGKAPAAAPVATAPPGVIGPGAKVVVKTAGGEGANIRDQPSINSNVVTSQDDGTALTVTGAKQDADGYTWWPVQGDGFSGWVAASLIELAP
ncbi:MAG: SH3 domain-containing protein [Thermomicrobiales bacterium]